MRVYRGLDEIGTALDHCALTIGNFDGVHTGHLRLLGEARRRAEKIGGPSATMTFSPHPGQILAPKKHPPLLTSDDKKARLIGQAGIDNLVFIPFTEEFAGYEPEKFVREVIFGRIRPREIVVGYDFCFGRNRSGNFETLKRLSDEFGYVVDVVGAHSQEGTIVSSSLIRKTIASGEIAAAARYLGRFYAVEGTVESGEQLGRQLGYPTANVAPISELVPPDGVYATFVRLGDAVIKGACSIGVRPTFEGMKRTIEVFLLDFDGDVYNQAIEVGFVARLRDQVKFESVEKLTAQIELDVKLIREILSTFSPDEIPF